MAPLEDLVSPAPLVPPRLSLLASIPVYDVVVDAEGRINEAATTARNVNGEAWRGAAISFTPEPCGGEGGVFDPSCGIPAIDISGDKSTVKVGEHFQAFGINEPESCSTFGAGGVDTTARAGRAMVLDEAKQVERELWTGTLAQAAGFTTNRWLARNVAGPGGNPQAVTQLNAGAATPPIRALGDLEMAIAAARSGGRSIIHATRLTVSYWVAAYLLYRVGNTLLTIATDTVVVPGEGYPGTAPDGTAMPANHNSAWAYATGPIEAFRTEVELVRPQGPELTSANRRTSIAKRLYALEIDPCVHVGINVSHPNT